MVYTSLHPRAGKRGGWGWPPPCVRGQLGAKSERAAFVASPRTCAYYSPRRMAAKHRVYLLPGFFGFANLGEVVYFGHVRNFLVDEFRSRGVDAEVHQVFTHPTASVRTRARDLLATLAQTAGDDGGPIHFVGHSTGGLDARLIVSPG